MAEQQPGSIAHEAQSWFDRHMLVGGALALGLGAIGQLLVFWLARGELDATFPQRVAAVIYTVAFWVAASLVVAVVGCRILHVRGGRAAALTFSSLVLGTLALVCASGIALRIISGSYLTAGALAFSLNSSDHFLHGASSGYAGWFGLVLVTAVAFGVGIAFGLRGAARTACWPGRRHGAILCGLAAVLTVGYAARAETPFTKGMFVSEPLLALVSSMDTDFELSRASYRPDAIGAPLAPPGPPRSEEARWREAIGTTPGERPNVILLMLESVSPRHMGLYGYERDTTPTLDALAKNGLWLKRAWATATHSNYAQMAVLSSLFPRRVHGLDQYHRLDYPRFLFHDTFAALGYATATISSQDENWQGMRRFQDTETPTFFWHSDDYTGEHLDSGVERVVPDDDTTDVVLGWLDKQHDKPWALYINFQATHFPYTISPRGRHPYLPDEPTWSTFGYLGYPESDKQVAINRYDNALVHVDEQVRRIRDHLESNGQLDKTLWVVTSDHGEMFFERGLVTHGKLLNDVESRVPIFLSWPGHISAEVREEPASHLDILPTALDVMGLPPHPSWQGKSRRLPTPESVGRDAVFINIQGLRFADAIVCWPWKLILERTSKKHYLFHLGDDPDEQSNLIEAQAEIASRLNDTLGKQLIAQLDYHVEGDGEKDERFQPRLRSCPRLD